MKRLPAFIAPVIALLVATSANGANADGEAAAQELFNKGRAAMDRKAFAEACSSFAASARLSTAVGPLLNLADCEEHLGKLTSARDDWSGALTRLEAQDPRVAYAKGRLETLERRIPRVTVRVDELEAPESLTVDDVATTPGVPLRLDPGAHVATLRMGGHTARRLSFEVREGESKDLVFGPEAAPAAPVVSPPPEAPAEPPLGGRRIAGVVAGSIGVAGVVAFGITGAVMASLHGTVTDPQHCPTSTTCDATGVSAGNTGRTLGIVNGLSLGLGVAGVAGGVILWTTGAPASPPSKTSASVVASPSSLVLRGSF